MGGGTYRQVCELGAHGRRGSRQEALQSGRRDLPFVIIVACSRAGKHDTASKKVAKYGAKSKVRAAWANKLQTRVRF
jgi:hypothetical protein